MSLANTALTLKDLPPSPENKTGWPWTQESEPLPDKMPDGSEWPRISIVTPSYNQGQFIEETIRSVLLQGYPNLEYIIMDGGSTDNTISILEKYTNWIDLWHSEKDNGQTHAINKGLKYASGFLRGYLNSDDLLLHKALAKVAHIAATHLGQPILILGNCEMGYTPKDIFNLCIPQPPVNFIDAISRDGLCPQPATFWTHPENVNLPSFNEHLAFCMDYDFWCQLIKSGYEVIKLDASLAFYRHHADAKGATLTNTMWSELAALPLLRITQVNSFEDKLYLSVLAKRRFRHYLRLEIEQEFRQQGAWIAFKHLVSAIFYDPGLLKERPTLGLARNLLLHRNI